MLVFHIELAENKKKTGLSDAEKAELIANVTECFDKKPSNIRVTSPNRYYKHICRVTVAGKIEKDCNFSNLKYKKIDSTQNETLAKIMSYKKTSKPKSSKIQEPVEERDTLSIPKSFELEKADELVENINNELKEPIKLDVYINKELKEQGELNDNIKNKLLAKLKQAEPEPEQKPIEPIVEEERDTLSIPEDDNLSETSLKDDNLSEIGSGSDNDVPVLKPRPDNIRRDTLSIPESFGSKGDTPEQKNNENENDIPKSLLTDDTKTNIRIGATLIYAGAMLLLNFL
mgnify:CR=1 FL=1